jgi:outer membrane protein assembly factor BamB
LPGCLLILAICAYLGSSVVRSARAEDWYRWRGPSQTGVSRETDLPETWSPDPKAENNNLIWKAPYGGRSTPIIMNGRVYYINSAGEGITGQERVLCLDAASGKLIWEYKFNVWHTDIDILRVGWTNLAGDPETGNIYAAGTQGLLLCFNKDGKMLWSHSLTEEYGRISGYGGRNSSPVVDGDLVIYGMLNASWGDQAGPGNRFLGLDKRTGVPVWWSAPTARPKDTYASVPVIAVINGERLLISGAGDGGIYALKVQTGEKVWGYMISAGGLSSTPVVDGTRVYICHGAENLDTAVQGRVVCLDASKIKDGKPALVWEKTGIKVRYTSPLIHEGRLIVNDEIANLYCFDAATGKEHWTYRYGRNAKGSPVWADGKIYVAEVNSRFHILRPGEKDCKELHSQFFPSPDGETDVELNGNPAVADGRVYFSTSFEMYCIGKKERNAKTGQGSTPRKEDLAAADAKPAHLQVVPAEVALEPGESATFKARTYDDHGRFLREVEAKWTLPAPTPPPGAAGKPPALKGEISADGKLTVDKMLPGQFGLVQADAEGLTSRARVRVVPRLPIRQDFKKVPEGAVPGGWVNCQGKFAVQTVNGTKVLKKLATNPSPLFARANAYMGKPDLTDYTVQADVLGIKKRRLPDMGIVANRYTLELDGSNQAMRIVSWESTPKPRIEKEIDWDWKPDVWYRMKLSVTFPEGKDGKGIIRGKVWERGKAEPANWTIELEDPIPNREGSPALYGYQTDIIPNQGGAEILYDNVSVTPNQHKE